MRASSLRQGREDPRRHERPPRLAAEAEPLLADKPRWKRFLQETLSKVQAELGLEKQKLESHLYELLLYETGSFFLPHRDGEKLDRMVATLVIVLPSSYEGGELIVRHEGQEQTIDFSSSRITHSRPTSRPSMPIASTRFALYGRDTVSAWFTI